MPDKNFRRIFAAIFLGTFLTWPARSADSKNRYYTGQAPTVYTSPNQNLLSRSLQNVPEYALPDINSLVHPVTAALPNSDQTVTVKPADLGLILSNGLPTLGPQVSTCGSIVSAGTYVLTQDLPSRGGDSGGLCISIQTIDGSTLPDVTLDCQGHSISSDVAAYYTTGLTITNCNITGGQLPVTIGYSQDYTLTHNTFGQSLSINCNGGTVADNTITGFYQQVQSSHMQIDDNNIVNGPEWGIAGIDSENGSANMFSGNHIDGGWDGSADDYDKVGLDDGFNIRWENGDQVTDNTINNVWDTGIETVGAIRNLTISGNQIDHTQVSAIGGWWSSSWNGVTIANNTANDVPTFLNFFYSQDQEHGPAPKTLAFENVKVLNNTLTNARPPLPGFPNTSVNVNLVPWYIQTGENGPSTILYGNNQLSGNNFDSSVPAPLLNPPDVFTKRGITFLQRNAPLRPPTSGSKQALKLKWLQRHNHLLDKLQQRLHTALAKRKGLR